MEFSQHVVYRSALVTIRDVFARDWSPGVVEPALDDASIVFIRYGTFARREANHPIVVDANYALFGRADEHLFADGDAKRPCACTVFQYHGAELKDRLLLHERPVLCTPRVYLLQARLLNDAWLRRAARSIDEAALQLASETFAGADAQRAASTNCVDIVRSIKELVNRSLAKPVSLTEVASALYLSPFTVSRIFHRETGVSLRAYVRRLRLRTALSRMLDGARLTDIASELGFYDEPHFSKAFHMEFGSAPALALGGLCNGAKP